MARINYEPHEDIKIQRIQQNVNRALERLSITALEELTATGPGKQFQSLYLTHTLGKSPRGAWLVYLKNKTDNTGPTLGAYLDWQPDPKGVKIRNITGLDDNSIYEVRLLVYA